jgi:hypothetical protein
VANSTILQLVQDAAGEMGLPVPSTVVSNSNLQVVQWLALAQSVGGELIRKYEWQFSTVAYRFNAVFYTYTGTLTEDSSTITALSSTTGLTTNPTYFMVVGDGVNQDTYLTSVNAGASTAVMTQPASASGTVQLTFSQTLYPLPSDFDRQIDNTQWDKSKRWQMLGPATAQQWEWLKSGWISTGPRIYYRLLANFFQIWPPQGIADYLGFEYVSKNWILATAATAPSKFRFTADTDTCVFPDRLMVAGLKKAYFASKGYAPIYDTEYAEQLSIAQGRDAGGATLSMSGARNASLLLTQSNVPDSGYGPST